MTATNGIAEHYHEQRPDLQAIPLFLSLSLLCALCVSSTALCTCSLPGLGVTGSPWSSDSDWRATARATTPSTTLWRSATRLRAMRSPLKSWESTTRSRDRVWRTPHHHPQQRQDHPPPLSRGCREVHPSGPFFHQDSRKHKRTSSWRSALSGMHSESTTGSASARSQVSQSRGCWIA